MTPPLNILSKIGLEEVEVGETSIPSIDKVTSRYAIEVINFGTEAEQDLSRILCQYLGNFWTIPTDSDDVLIVE